MPVDSAARRAPGGRLQIRVLYDFLIFRMERRGGISRYISELARRLAATGQVRPTIFAGLHDNEFIAGQAGASGVVMIGSRAAGGLASSTLGGALNYTGFEAFHRLAGRFDVYHPSYYPRRLQRPRKSRLVATVYDMIHERLPEFHHGDPTPRRKRALVDAADIIICISRTTANDLVALYGTDPRLIRVIYLGAASAQPESAPATRPAPAPPARPYFIYVGRRSGYKNFAALLEAFIADEELRRETSLVAVGGGPWTNAEQKLLGMAGRDASILRIDADEIALYRLYSNAIALVIPSLYEGFGLPAVEAMRAGCPVVANATGSLPEIVGEAGIVRPLQDRGELARTLREVAANPALRSELRARGLVRSAAFNWETTAAETLEAYRTVMSGG